MIHQRKEYAKPLAYESLLLHWLAESHNLYINVFKNMGANASITSWIAGALAYVEAVKALYSKLTPNLKEDIKATLGGDPEKLLKYDYDLVWQTENGGIKKIIVKLPEQESSGNPLRDSKIAAKILVEKARRIETTIIESLDKHGLLLHIKHTLLGGDYHG